VAASITFILHGDEAAPQRARDAIRQRLVMTG
jgi:hypothetical protein